ncbi:helix-turn-helix domain-containing protein [Streptomyces sp. NPDC056400]|uniref:helix-turn-helix domain-containing protein n=1 Tax=Streptomyces sp. NPDC056400 TaxID=3345808 RepID=UPI0035DF4558
MASTTPADYSFGTLLHALRRRAGLSQEDLAHAAGVSVRGLSYLEKGRSRGPQRRTVQALAKALGLDAAGARELEDAASAGRRRPIRTTDAPAPPLSPSPDVPAAAPASEATVNAPDLLPRAPRGFHGRAAELDALTRATAGEAPVCLVVGPAGVGKTALVLHWARHDPAGLADGRLYADLRGFSDMGEPSAAEVLREFLLGLGIAPERIPESEPAAAALFRSLAADRQLLVVLDNARDSDQVRPLLPGGDRCVTVVTSRHRLPGLIVTDTACPVPLDVLAPPRTPPPSWPASSAPTGSTPRRPPHCASRTCAADCRWRCGWSPPASPGGSAGPWPHSPTSSPTRPAALACWTWRTPASAPHST